MQHRVDDVGHCRAVKRPTTGDHFVNDHTERKNVALGIDVFLQNLLRAHVTRIPRTTPSDVNISVDWESTRPKLLARPKSNSLAPPFARMTLPGFTSR